MVIIIKRGHMTQIDLSEWMRMNKPVTKRSKSLRKLIYGLGINDASYLTYIMDGKKMIKCPAYRAWMHILARSYSKNYHEKQPTYKGVTVCDEWLLFSNFRKWWMTNYIEGYHLDKDLLILSNKIYSPETCIYVPQWLNSFTINNTASRGKYKIGVCWNNEHLKFHSRCSNPYTKKNDNLGYFDNELEAHSAWLTRKLEIALDLKQEMDEIDLRIYLNVVEIIKSLI